MWHIYQYVKGRDNATPRAPQLRATPRFCIHMCCDSVEDPELYHPVSVGPSIDCECGGE